MSLPQNIGVSSAVQRAARYGGLVAEERFARLTADGMAWAEPCEAQLQFGREGRRRHVDCEIRGMLTLRCQPCGQPFDRVVRIDTRWVLVETDEEEQSALADAEPVRFVDDLLAVDEALEQEVMLDLPVLARCPACEQKVAAMPSVTPKVEPTHRPFAGLKLGKR